MCIRDSPRSDVYCLLLAFEEAKRKSFSTEDCKRMGIHAVRCREAEQLAREFCDLVGIAYHLEVPVYQDLAKLLLQCFPSQVAHLVSGGRNVYQDSLGRHFHLSKHSVMGSEKFVLPLQMVEKKIRGRMVLEMLWANGLDESLSLIHI